MHPVQLFELVFIMLLAILVLHWIALRLKLPPAVALLVGGGALAFVPGLSVLELDPELVLVLFLPPLLMDGAYFTAHAEFRKHLAGVLSLAIGAVVFTTLIIGIVTHWLLPNLPWAACFALGAIVSPPDAVSARAVLQSVKLPRRLSTLLEGESLLNDATGLVLFRFAIVAALTGTFSLSAAAGQFLVLALRRRQAIHGAGGPRLLYCRVRQDEGLGPIFAHHIAGECEPHLDRALSRTAESDGIWRNHSQAMGSAFAADRVPSLEG